MRVILIYPEFPDTFWSLKHAVKFIGKKAASPPLGLLTVAALLPERWEKRLVDLNVGMLTDKCLQWADVAFISAMAVQRQSTEKVIERCRQAGVRVVAGGPLFTCEPDHFPQVDHLVLNEAEITLPPFLADLERGEATRVYGSGEFADLGTSPVPLWELADLGKYGAMSIQYSRGCPYRCEFCNVTALLGHRPRTKSAAQVLSELDALYARGWRSSIFFVDDNFIGNRRQLAQELLPALIQWRRDKRGISFYTEASIDLAGDEELTRLMVEAGFEMVFIGIETPEEASLTESRKWHNRRRDLLEDVKRLQRAGLQVQGGFIVGFDSDTPSIFQRQIEFIQKSGIVTAMVGLLQAPSGTRLYERLKREGRLLGELWSGDNVRGLTNIIPKMDYQILKEGYRSILQSIYSPESYYQRIKTFLREYRPPKRRAALDLQHKMAFFRAVFRLGIFGSERVQFWKVFFWTLLRRPSLMPQAITLAIYGYHFRKVCETSMDE